VKLYVDTLRENLKETESALIQTNSWMYYWYGQNKSWERVDSLNQKLIEEYELQTGVSARSAEDLRRQMELNKRADKEAIDALNVALDAAIKGEKKANRRKVIWKTVSIVGIPVAVAGGVYLGLLIK
jgi:phosphoribosylanthranilate isomerase